MSKKYFIVFGLFLAAGFVFSTFLLFKVPFAEAATITSTITGGDWATGTTWVGGVVPVESEDVVIATTGADAVTLGVATSTANITINSGATLNGSTFLLTVTGNYTNNGTHSGSGGVTVSGASSVIDGTGNITNTGTFTISGITAPSIALTATLTFSGTVSVGTAVTNNGTVTLSAATSLSGLGNFTNASGATLNIAGISDITTLTPAAATNTINYTGTAQTVHAVATNDYWHLGFSGTGANTISLPGTVTAISGNLALSGTANVTTGAALSIAGTLTIGTGTTLATGATNTWTLTVTGATSITGTLTLANTGDKTFTGNVTVNAGGVWNETGVAAVGFASNLTNNATTWTASTGAHTFSGATKVISGATATVIPSVSITGTIANSNTLTVATLLTIASLKILTNNGTITATTALSGLGEFINAATGTLNIGGISDITTLTASAVGNTVNYTAAAGGQTIKGTTYDNLTLSNTSGTDTASGAITATTLTTTAGGTLNMVTFDLVVTTITNNGTIRTQSLSATPLTTGKTWGGTVNYDATTGAQTVMVGTYGVLTLSNTSGTDTASGDLVVTGTLTIGSGATLDAAGATLTLSGSGTPLVITGTFSADGSTVVYSSTSATNIAAATYSSLQITGAATKTLLGNTTATSTLTLSTAGSILDGGGYTLTLSGSGTPLTKSSGKGIFQNIPTITYSSASATNIATGTYANLVLTGAITKTLLGNTTATSTVTIPASGTLAIGTYTFTATDATWTNGGTVSEGTGGKIVLAAAGVLSNSAGGGAVTSFGSFDSYPVIHIQITDTSLNLVAATVETKTATVTGTSGITDSETVTLTETTVSSGIFRGSLTVNLSGSNVTGKLDYQGNGTVSYAWTDSQDADDTESGSASFTGTTPGGGSGGGGGGAATVVTTTTVTTPILTVTPETTTPTTIAPAASTLESVQSKVTSVIAKIAALPANPTASDLTSIQAEIAAILADLQTLQATATPQGAALGYNFVRPLAFGMSHNDVRNLQTALKTDSSIYPGGKVTGYFGPATLLAIKKFQEKYGIASSGQPGYGNVGPATRAKLNELYGSK